MYIYDVVVIGGGPAGMISAGKASSLNKNVILLEKNPSLGNKLLITGGGRCNVTNINSDLKKIYKKAGKYLYSTYSQFNIEDTLDFFHNMGMDTKIEEYGRVFPISNRSQTVLGLLTDYMKKNNVKIECNTKVLKIEKENEIFNVYTDKGIIYAKSCIVSTGGLSHPETGSTGDGFNWLRDLGHNIIKPNMALVPIALKEKYAKYMPGLALDDVKVTIYVDNIKEFAKRGRILFTHVGLSGPMILNMSKRIGELLNQGIVTISLDIYPSYDIGTLRKKLNDILMENNNKTIGNTLHKFIPKSLVNTILEVADIDSNIYCHSLKKESRYMIVDSIKNLRLTVNNLLGKDKAIVSSGGVDIDEINFNTMESKKIKGLYVVGDMLDIDRPSGGYSLQLCWSTGYVAGIHC